MKIKVEIEVDTESGDYELTFYNLGEPGEGMDLFIVQEATRRVLHDWLDQQEN